MRRDQLQRLRVMGVGILALGTVGWAGDSACAKDSPREVQRYIRVTSWGSGPIRLHSFKKAMRPLPSDHGRTGRSAQRLMREMHWIRLPPEESARVRAVKIRPHIPMRSSREVRLGQQVKRITTPQIRRFSQRQVQAGRSARSLSRSKDYTVTPEMAATGRSVTKVVQQIIRRPPTPKADPLAKMKLQKARSTVDSNPMAGVAKP